jgi:streptomycin 6-kinase
MMLGIPEGLADSCRRDPARVAWLARLPDLVNDLTRRWSLTLGQPFLGEGSCAWVARVTRASGIPAVLKVGLPHFEGEHEIAGLRFWEGDATVELLAAAPDANAMLLELCEPGTLLRALPEPEQDVVLGAMLQRLRRAPPTDTHSFPFRPLGDMLAHWANETCAAEDHWPDRALVRDGLLLADELIATTAEHVVLFTDLHAGNVLRAQRAPWLAIDPKPFVGDPAFDATQHLMNCRARMRSAPRATMDRFADLLGVSRERVRGWMFARAAAEPREDWAESPWIEIARTIRP